MEHLEVRTYHFVVFYKHDAVEIPINAYDEQQAMEIVFDNLTSQVRPGWHSIMPCFDVSLVDTTQLPRMRMVVAASKRSFVQMQDGRIGRLIRWDTKERPKTARVEIKPGKYLTFKCAQVKGVQLVEAMQ